MPPLPPLPATLTNAHTMYSVPHKLHSLLHTLTDAHTVYSVPPPLLAPPLPPLSPTLTYAHTVYSVPLKLHSLSHTLCSLPPPPTALTHSPTALTPSHTDSCPHSVLRSSQTALPLSHTVLPPSLPNCTTSLPHHKNPPTGALQPRRKHLHGSQLPTNRLILLGMAGQEHRGIRRGGGGRGHGRHCCELLVSGHDRERGCVWHVGMRDASCVGACNKRLSLSHTTTGIRGMV